jgi:hypothetical protein
VSEPRPRPIARSPTTATWARRPADPDERQTCNRAADRQIDLGSPGDDQGEIDDVIVLVDLPVVTRSSSSKGCSPRSQIIEARRVAERA